MTSKILKITVVCGLLFGLVNCGSAKSTEITINAPEGQKYSLNFNVKESICIKNVEKLAKTIGQKDMTSNRKQVTFSGKQVVSAIRDFNDEDGQCENSPAVLYFTINTNKKIYSCLMSYVFGGKKIKGLACHEAKSKQKTDKCMATKLDDEKTAAEVNITC